MINESNRPVADYRGRYVLLHGGLNGDSMGRCDVSRSASAAYDGTDNKAENPEFHRPIIFCQRKGETDKSFIRESFICVIRKFVNIARDILSLYGIPTLEFRLGN